MLLAFADALFAPEAPRAPDSWRLRYLGAAALVAAVVVARRPDMVTNPQFWGEDGFVFFRDQLLLGCPRALGNAYMGFPQLGQRLIAVVGGLVPLSAAPRVYAALAIAVTALGLASFTAPAFRHLVRSDALRLLWSVATASLPLETGTLPVQWNGVLGNPANLGWWVAVWLSLLSLMRLPRERWRVALLAMGGALAVFTTPTAPINAPLWVLRAWRAYRRSDARELAFAVCLLAALATCAVLFPGLGANAASGVRLSFFAMPGVYLGRSLFLACDRVAAFFLPYSVLSALRASAPSATVGFALGVAAILATLALLGRRRPLPGLVASLYLFVGSLTLTMLGRLAWALLPVANLPARYTILPASMLLLALAIVVDDLAPRLRLVALGLVATVLAVGWAPRFRLPPFQDLHWPRYAALLRRKLDSGSTAPLTIPMNPRWTPLAFDTRPSGSGVHVAASRPLATLGAGVFEQTFVCRCDGLDGVVVQLVAPTPSERGELAFSLVEQDGTERVMAEATVPRDELASGPEPFFFSPIAGSAGRRYAIRLRAVDPDPAAPVQVLGADADAYREGRALFAGASADVDASFDYSCAAPDGR